MNRETRCPVCDEWYDPKDAEHAIIHNHPEPQSGPPRDSWIRSGLPYKRWIIFTPEGRDWDWRARKNDIMKDWEEGYSVSFVVDWLKAQSDDCEESAQTHQARGNRAMALARGREAAAYSYAAKVVGLIESECSVCEERKKAMKGRPESEGLDPFA